MPQIVVRQLPDEVHIALKVRAKLEGKSAEAVVRDILREDLLPKGSLGFGQRLAAVWSGADKAELHIERAPYEPIELE